MRKTAKLKHDLRRVPIVVYCSMLQRNFVYCSRLRRTKGQFHAFRRMKREFSLLFETCFGHEKLQNWSLRHGYSEKKRNCSMCIVELRYASVFLCAARISPFSPSLPIRNGV